MSDIERLPARRIRCPIGSLGCERHFRAGNLGAIVPKQHLSLHSPMILNVRAIAGDIHMLRHFVTPVDAPGVRDHR
jgi:hypothetical protein